MVSQNNYYLVELASSEFVNKIELKKLFKKISIDAIKVNTVFPPIKNKKRGKKQNKIEVQRPRKYFVQLKIGQTLDETTITKLNELK